MAETALEASVKAAGDFAVDPQLCIACDACCQDFPEVFYMGDDAKAHAKADQQAALYNARTVVDVCPTSAISFSGELPPPVLEVKLEEVEGWEAEWALWRDAPEDTLERDRRYGRDFTVDEEPGYLHIRLQLPTRVPAVRDRFRYGAPEEMPEYKTHVYQEGRTVHLTAWVPRLSEKDKADVKLRKAQILALTHTSKSFPGRFTTSFDFPGKDIVGLRWRHHSSGEVEVLAFTDRERMESWQWRAHFITDRCTACSICERVCPTNAISSGERYLIDPDLCINCSVCGVYCPFDAIDDSHEVVVQKIKPKQVPKAVVHEELCTGCEFCVDVCPFEALTMRALSDEFGYSQPQTNTVAHVIEKNCVSCKLCEQVCIKEAIEVPRAHQFMDIGMSFMSYLSDDH